MGGLDKLKMAFYCTRNNLELDVRRIKEKLQEAEENISSNDSALFELSADQEKLEDRLLVAEEENQVLKIQNVELTKHLNVVIKEVNNMKAWMKVHWQAPELYKDFTSVDAVDAVDDLKCTEEITFDKLSDDSNEEEENNPTPDRSGRS